MRAFVLTTGLTPVQMESLALAILVQGHMQKLDPAVEIDEGVLFVRLNTEEEERALAFEAAVRCALMALRS